MRKYLVELREKRNESQQTVADRLGISRQYYAMIENGTRQKCMDMPLLVGLASVFGLTTEKIIAFEQEYQKSAAQ